ncbi:glutamate--tRNA ligase [Striga asiatica]|uniref:Glutamate--tRNA ligase n=1 Tax=Striga asiatica TaxID=4170 RepID=A0A5A7R7H2_STRAF|nr:glutamate--tRNA ligase [Striga asiatica]
MQSASISSSLLHPSEVRYRDQLARYPPSRTAAVQRCPVPVTRGGFFLRLAPDPDRVVDEAECVVFGPGIFRFWTRVGPRGGPGGCGGGRRSGGEPQINGPCGCFGVGNALRPLVHV